MCQATATMQVAKPFALPKAVGTGSLIVVNPNFVTPTNLYDYVASM